MAVLILRDSGRTDASGTPSTAYSTGDLIATAEDTDNVDMPPSHTFLVLMVTGITKAEVDQYVANSTTSKKLWYIEMNRMTTTQRTYLTTRRHLGFGGQVAKYGAEVADDVVVLVAEARTWIVNKTTGRDANGVKI